MTDLPSPKRLLTGLAGLALLASACGSDAGGLEATGAWARTSPMNADAGAAYMVISSDEALTITSAEVSSDIAARVELHETVPVGHDDSMDDESMDDMEDESMDDESMGDMDEDSMDDMADMAMTMQELTGGLAIPADGEVTLEPGGLHVMLFDLAEPLETGDTFDLTFNTDADTSFTVSVEVRDDAP